MPLVEQPAVWGRVVSFKTCNPLLDCTRSQVTSGCLVWVVLSQHPLLLPLLPFSKVRSENTDSVLGKEEGFKCLFRSTGISPSSFDPYLRPFDFVWAGWRMMGYGKMENVECKKTTRGLKCSQCDTVDILLCPYSLSLGGLLWEERTKEATMMVSLSFYVRKCPCICWFNVNNVFFLIFYLN